MPFIVIEGANGSGKSVLTNRFKTIDGFDTLYSPGSTELSKYLRPVCRGTDEWIGVDPHIQFLAFSLSRTDEYLRLVHNNKKTIIAARWWTSTYCYQCKLQKFPVSYLEHTIYPNEVIDYVFILDAKPETLISRVEKERNQNPDHKVCTWAKEHDTIKQLQQIYKNDLPIYLDNRKIKNEVVNTETLDENQVFQYVLEKINYLQGISSQQP